MSREKLYSPHQFKQIQTAVEHQVKKLGNQKKLALAMGISQQSVASILSGSYRPAPDKAEQVALLEGFESLEEMIGPYTKPEATPAPGATKSKTLPNLETCLSFHVGVKSWSPWVIAAARAGYFGPEDTTAPGWIRRLDELEEAMRPKAAPKAKP